MKLWVLVFFVSVILIIYAIPTFYEAGVEKRVIKTARLITKDLIGIRFLCLSKGTEYHVTFITTGRQGYNIFDGTKLLKTVYLDQIDSNVVFSSLFNDKGVIFENNTVVFKPVREVNTSVQDGYDSILLNNNTKESKKDLKSVVRIYINKNSYEIKLFRVHSIKENGDLVFKEI